MSYLTLRHLHLACAVVSIALFSARGILSLMNIDWRHRWPVLRWLPHVNDAMLLGAGLSMAILSGQLPNGDQPWLLGKVVLLVLYVLLGKQALAPGLTAQIRFGWLAGAWLTVGSIVALALTRARW